MRFRGWDGARPWRITWGGFWRDEVGVVIWVWMLDLSYGFASFVWGDGVLLVKKLDRGWRPDSPLVGGYKM